MPNSEKQVALKSWTPVPGERHGSVLQPKVRTHSILLTIEATVDVTADAAASRNRGSVLALFDEVGLNVDGEDRIILDPRSARMWNEVNAISPLPSSRFTDVEADSAAYRLRETLRLDLANPRLAFPEETAFSERDTLQSMEVFMKYNGLGTKLFGGGTVVVSAPTVRVQQVYDPFRSELPLFRPSVRQVSSAVPGANDRQEISLKGSRYFGGVLIQQDSDAGEVSDMINTIAILGGDGKDIIPQQMPWLDAVEHSQGDSGGNVAGSRAYLGVNFLKKGRLSKLVHPYSYGNLRLVLDVVPSVTAGATNGKIRVTIFEYERDTELTTAALPDFTL